ncbi:hypothetical protein O6P43_035140 [Quillaja saponaria]|uniref:Uncharacterized protein n=1 Tax=Quillaja saponaria TaxID=32244 RepID=A0AAD7P4J6_QUISA|nr:hypothetical protein O6P43_035140 [Quillaja saponaria]
MPYSQEKLERPSTKGYLYPKPTQLRVEGEEGLLPGGPEPSVRYHSGRARILTLCQDLRAKGQSQVDSFLWGVGLPKGNGGVQRFPRARRRLALECKGRRELDCKTHPSSRDESRP